MRLVRHRGLAVYPDLDVAGTGGASIARHFCMNDDFLPEPCDTGSRVDQDDIRAPCRQVGCERVDVSAVPRLQLTHSPPTLRTTGWPVRRSGPSVIMDGCSGATRSTASARPSGGRIEA